MLFPKNIFITGTDTGVGKTIVSSVLLAGLGYTYWKPVQSGSLATTDTDIVKNLTGLPDERFLAEGYRLHTPASPHVSAAQDGLEIDMANLRIPICTGNLLVEGAGGLLVPLNAKFLMIDLIKMLGMPVLLVARSGLGTINHTLLSLEALRDRGIDVFGVVVNGERQRHNCRAIEYYGKVSVLAELEPLQDLTPRGILTAFQTNFS